MQTPNRNQHSLRAAIPHARRLDLVKNKADESTLYVYGVIGEDFFGDGISALDFAKQVAQAPPGTLHLRINSPGGDVFEGRAMAQAIREYKGIVTAHVDGVAASAATFLCCAAGHVSMAKGSMFMVHNAWTMAGGNSEDLLQTAALLEKIDGQIAADYASTTGATVEQAREWMNKETWFTETEAVDAKFANEIAPDQDGAKAMAAWDMRAYANAPKPVASESNIVEELKAILTAVQTNVTEPDNGFDEAKRRFALIESRVA